MGLFKTDYLQPQWTLPGYSFTKTTEIPMRQFSHRPSVKAQGKTLHHQSVKAFLQRTEIIWSKYIASWWSNLKCSWNLGERVFSMSIRLYFSNIRCLKPAVGRCRLTDNSGSNSLTTTHGAAIPQYWLMGSPLALDTRHEGGRVIIIL